MRREGWVGLGVGGVTKEGGEGISNKGVDGGGSGERRIDRKLLNIKWVTCVFLFKTPVLRVSAEAEGPSSWPPEASHMHRICWRCKREGRRPFS